MTLLFIIIVIALGAILTTGSKSKTETGTDSFIPETPPPPGDEKRSLQLNTLKFRKIELPKGNACKANPFNEEPDIIYATDPAFGGAAQAGGQIRIWVWEDDGTGGSVSQGTKVDPATGLITTPGDRTLADNNGYLWEPSIYITKLTSPDQPGPYAGDKENGGQPYFPTAIKGVANQRPDGGTLTSVPIDPPVNIIVDRTGEEWTFSEFIWDVNSMGLTTGYYRAQIILHDGDQDLAINCTTIQI